MSEYYERLAREEDQAKGPRYARELDRAAELLTDVLPIGRCKAVGRLEVAAAVAELVLMYDREKARADRPAAGHHARAN